MSVGVNFFIFCGSVGMSDMCMRSVNIKSVCDFD